MYGGNDMVALNVIPERKKNTSNLLPLNEYDLFIVSFSGGKDSLAALLHLLELGVPKEKIELWHQHVDGEPGSKGLMDWPCTEAYCRAAAEAMGMTLRFQWKHGGFEREMLRENARTAPVSFELSDGTIGTAGGQRGNLSTRLKFPQVSADLSVRWCSAYLKIDVAAMAVANDPRLKEAKICYVSGERRQESAARAKYAEIERHRTSNLKRRVDHWRNVIDWSEEKVWDIIRRWRINPHPAYQLGWGRVSCLACIFGDRDQWASVRVIAPDSFNAIDAYEKRFGVTIKRGESVVEQADKGEAFVLEADPELVRKAMSKEFLATEFFIPEWQDWKLPAGAFKHCAGPV